MTEEAVTVLLERDLAWQLVDAHRAHLDSAEHHRVYVHLGIEDYPPVIACVLGALARARKTLPDSQIRQVTTWIDCYHQHAHADLVKNITDTADGKG